MKKLAFVASLAAGLLCANAFADEVKLHGAVTTVDLAIAPHKAAVEQATGLTLTVVGNSSGKGMSDLLDGKCDGMLAAADLNSSVASVKSTGKEVDASKLNFSLLMNDEIVFFVNPANPVKKLTMAQIKGILTGKIANWKEVGGEDAPILIIAEIPTGATRSAIKALALDGEDYAGSCKVQPNVKAVVQKVGEFKNAIGGVSRQLAAGQKVQVLESDKKIERPLGIITVGAPSAKVQKAIDAIKAAIKSSN